MCSNDQTKTSEGLKLRIWGKKQTNKHQRLVGVKINCVHTYFASQEENRFLGAYFKVGEQYERGCDLEWFDGLFSLSGPAAGRCRWDWVQINYSVTCSEHNTLDYWRVFNCCSRINSVFWCLSTLKNKRKWLSSSLNLLKLFGFDWFVCLFVCLKAA